MSALVWVHEDNLSPRNPALIAYPAASSVFVWDDAAVEAEGYSLKRIVFIYECLLELPVEIHRGPLAETLQRLAKRAGATTIATAESVNPRYLETVRSIEQHFHVEILAADPFIPHSLEADLRRFARFWKRAEPHAFRRTER